MRKFTHLHCHTQYSLLDGAAKIKPLLSQTKALGMQALAITDHGNMFGVPHFVSAAHKQGVKPIIGCEFYLAPNRHDRKDKRRYHQLLLAKNNIGYQNLITLSSLGFLEGYYYKPRIDKQLIREHREGLIATTCCLAAEIPRAILEQGEEAAEKLFLEWLDIFGKDYYIELQRHGIDDQDKCNAVLLRWAEKHGVKVIASNDVHYIEQKDHLAQDILLCLQTGKDYDDPNRMRFENDQFYLKSPEEMAKIFHDVPHALENTEEIVEKVDTLHLERDVLLPIFQLPDRFTSQRDYLAHLALEGAKKRYGEISASLKQRIDYELGVISDMGYAGYFLIVQDFVLEAKKMGVIVGPGRGSVAGSVVAYSLGITEVDPLRYNLIFERFLNPDRVSMPDIDTDFDDEGRQKVIDYVAKKYGYDQVAHIVTFGSMAAKSAIRDIARVLRLPLSKADYLAKLVPERPNVTLAQAFKEVPELEAARKNGESLESKVLKLATTLEGVVRHTGIHAAGIIISPDNITKYVPVLKDKSSGVFVTQYDGSIVEDVGMLKMDFLGLTTLSILRDARHLIKKNHHTDIKLEEIPLEDTKTYELYQKAETIGTFQFESVGMRKWLPQLKPSNIHDLIAMNALYRPGPMQFIPNFIARKHGKEETSYPHPKLEDLLKNTYGIMVYQEQIMQTAQIIAGYTLAQADLLRRVMGKKKVEEMAKHRSTFIEGAQKQHNITEAKAKDIFSMMEKFAEYGFPKSHSTAYALVAYWTAYLKANYPSEYMATVLKHSSNDMTKIAFFVAECTRMNIKVDGPDINESGIYFSANLQGTIRFGLAAIKGVGEAAVQVIIEERNQNGPFKSIYDFFQRIPHGKLNKRVVENLALAGAFDNLPEKLHRRQYTYTTEENPTLIERLLQYSQKVAKTKNSQQQSLFAHDEKLLYGKPPAAPSCEEYTKIEKLTHEKELIGYYISGHPLDEYVGVIQSFCDTDTQSLLTRKNQEVRFAAIVTQVTQRQTKNGQPFLQCTLEDFKGTLSLTLFRDAFQKFQSILQPGATLHITAHIKPRYAQSDQWEVHPTYIVPLAQVAKRKVKQLQIRIEIPKLTKEKVSSLTKTLTKYPGKCALQVILVDTKTNVSLSLNSQNYQVAPSSTLLDTLSDTFDFGYKLA
ncbi:MAG: DNA polymerase III subunit alpha [Bacteroidota bacterium]